MRAMVSAAIRDIEAIRATLPLEKRRHSEIVLHYLRQALSDLVLDVEPQGAGVVVRLDVARRARVSAVRR